MQTIPMHSFQKRNVSLLTLQTAHSKHFLISKQNKAPKIDPKMLKQ